jgi:hypothetical protein
VKGPPAQIKVNLGGVHLSEEQGQRMGAEIQRVVLANLAQAGIKAPAGPVRLGPWIWGFILNPQLVPGLAGGQREG